MFSEYVYCWDQIDLCTQLLPYQVSSKLVYKQISSLLTYYYYMSTYFPSGQQIFSAFSAFFFYISTVGRANFVKKMSKRRRSSTSGTKIPSGQSKKVEKWSKKVAQNVASSLYTINFQPKRSLLVMAIWVVQFLREGYKI